LRPGLCLRPHARMRPQDPVHALPLRGCGQVREPRATEQGCLARPRPTQGCAEQSFFMDPVLTGPSTPLGINAPERALLPGNLPISERYHRARSSTTRANSPAARTRQHVAASPVVPTHKVGLDGVLTEQHRHRIVDMSGRNVPVRVHALQSLNKSLFECVDHYRRLVARLCKAR
jgi:hypothetical protein